VEDGHYTGRALRVLHGAEKADAVRELARREGIDLEASTAYSDSDSDRPFLEAVGNPVAVNPDRALRVTAAEHGWPVLEFGRRAYPHARRRVPAALVVVPLLLGAALALRSRAG
jgi:phosphoserine phosphatase